MHQRSKITAPLLPMLMCLLVWQGVMMTAHAQWPGDESQVCDTNKQSAAECAGHVIVPAPSCLCSDVPVQGSGTAYSCAQEYNVGNCGQSFLKDAIVGIPEGYCQLTCGQCNCSKTITQVLQQLQANTFLQAATTTGLKAQFDLPGFTATVLAPTDAAFATLLNGAPLSSMSNDALLALLEQHVLPPVAGLLAPWTTTFFVTNPTLPTWLGAAALTTAKATAGGANYTVTGAGGPAANIVTADMEAGRSYVNLLDGVLAVPPGAVPQPLPAAGTGPNGGVPIETFNMTASPTPSANMNIQTAG